MYRYSRSSLQHVSLLPLLERLTEGDVPLKEVLASQELISKRSTSSSTMLLAIVAYCTTTNPLTRTPRPEIPYLLAFTIVIIIWSIFVRAHYEGLSPSELKRRVTKEGPLLVAIIYLVPEVYVLVFLIVELDRVGGHAVAVIVVITLIICVALVIYANMTRDEEEP